MLFQDINAWNEGREAPSAAYSSNNYMRRGSRRTCIQLYRSAGRQVKPATTTLGWDRQVKTSPDLVVVVRQFDGTIRLARRQAFERGGMIGRLEVDKLQSARGRNDDDPLVGPDFSPGSKLDERREGHSRMRAGEHPRAVRARHGIGDLLLARLLPPAPAPLQRGNRLVDRHGVPDLNRGGQTRA